ncbi:hypothetical protein NX059_000430 [Plenodomus lindquistii]|nr:hypothetical protein NX059_000430 [Plenodomus lindquistii]
MPPPIQTLHTLINNPQTAVPHIHQTLQSRRQARRSCHTLAKPAWSIAAPRSSVNGYSNIIERSISANTVLNHLHLPFSIQFAWQVDYPEFARFSGPSALLPFHGSTGYHNGCNSLPLLPCHRSCYSYSLHKSPAAPNPLG